MTTLQVELPDPIVRELENAVRSGFFANPSEIIVQAVREFVSRRRFEIIEEQQLKDIASALEHRFEKE